MRVLLDGACQNAQYQQNLRQRDSRDTSAAPDLWSRALAETQGNPGYEVSLERRKLYATIPDPEAPANGQIRVIDESGEDYLFPSELFVAVELAASVRRALA